MDKLWNRIAYLQGFSDAMKISDSKEGQVIREVIEVMEEMAESLQRFDDRMEEQEQYLEAVDEDLSDLESLIYDDDFYDEDETENEYNLYDDDDVGYFEIECPNCNELIAVDQGIFDDDLIAEVICPECEYTIVVNEDPDKDGNFVRYIIDDESEHQMEEKEKNQY